MAVGLSSGRSLLAQPSGRRTVNSNGSATCYPRALGATKSFDASDLLGVMRATTTSRYLPIFGPLTNYVKRDWHFLAAHHCCCCDAAAGHTDGKSPPQLREQPGNGSWGAGPQRSAAGGRYWMLYFLRR